MGSPAPRKTSRWNQGQHPAAQISPPASAQPAPQPNAAAEQVSATSAAPTSAPKPAAAARASLQVSIDRDLLTELRNAYNFTAQDGQTWAAWVETALRAHVARCRADLGFPDGVPGSGVLAPRAGVRTGRPPKNTP